MIWPNAKLIGFCTTCAPTLVAPVHPRFLLSSPRGVNNKTHSSYCPGVNNQKTPQQKGEKNKIILCFRNIGIKNDSAGLIYI